jgi:type I restriction enzyme M protein
LTNNKPASRKQQVRIIDARKQFDKEPKSFGNKRNRILDRHRQWIEELYRSNWTDDQQNDHAKIFRNKDFAYHKVSVVFWQTDENDQPAYLTEPYTKAFTPANIKKEQQFYESDLDFRIHLKLNTIEREISFSLGPEESFVKILEKEVKKAFAEEIAKLTENLATAKEKNNMINAFIKVLEVTAEFTHRHYVSDNEYIQYGEDIEEFLKREIAKPIMLNPLSAGRTARSLVMKSCLISIFINTSRQSQRMRY